MQPENKEQTRALKAFAKALKIKYVSDENPSPSGDEWFLNPRNIAAVEKGMADNELKRVADAKNIWTGIL